MSASVNVQWKGTDVCLDFYCECGMQGHIDAYIFSGVIECDRCGACYKLPSAPPIEKIESGDTRAVLILDDDPEESWK